MGLFTSLLGIGTLGLASNILDAGSSAVNYYYNRKNMDYQYKYNLALQQDAQKYNTSAMSLANQFNVENAATSQGYLQSNMNLDAQLQRQNWQYAFDQQNAYNDPSAQRSRLNKIRHVNLNIIIRN